MSKWQHAYETGFRVDTDEPSQLARSVIPRLSRSSRVLDIGCGNGRNSLYALRNGHVVDAIDEVDMRIVLRARHEERERLRFTCGSITRAELTTSYDAVFMLRFIQYISRKQLRDVLSMIGKHMSSESFLAVSYSESGGYMRQSDFDIDIFDHPIESVVDIISGMHMRLVEHAEGNHSSFVGEPVAAVTHDLLFQRKD